MADDKEYIDGLFEMDREIHLIIEQFNRRAAELSLSGKDGMVALKLEQNAALTEALKKHRRVMDYWLGNPIEPVAHVGEAVLTGVGMAGGG